MPNDPAFLPVVVLMLVAGIGLALTAIWNAGVVQQVNGASGPLALLFARGAGPARLFKLKSHFAIRELTAVPMRITVL